MAEEETGGTTHDGYELHVGDLFYLYVASEDLYVRYEALAIDPTGTYVFYDKTASIADDNQYGRAAIADTYIEEQYSYRMLYELAQDMDDDIERIQACCECAQDDPLLDNDVSFLVSEAYRLGRENL